MATLDTLSLGARTNSAFDRRSRIAVAIGLTVLLAMPIPFRIGTVALLRHAWPSRPVLILGGANEWLVWVAALPLIWYVCRRFPVVSGPKVRALAIHLTLALTLITIRALVGVFGDLDPSDPVAPMLVATLGFSAGTGLITYAAIAAVMVAVDLVWQRREREAAALRQEAQFARAELHVMRAQLQPHFLFNTLNTVAMLVRTDRPSEALSVLEGFGTLLRQMQITDAVEVPLHEELAFVSTYLTLQQARFGDHLTTEIDAPADTHDILVPRLFLQPLVENAVRHGLAQREEPGVITVRARAMGGELIVEVMDDGPPLPPGWTLARRSGVGLTTVARSLQLLHPVRHRLELTNVVGAGVRATVAFPASRSPSSSAAFIEQPS